MKRLLAASVIAISLASAEALAQERASDAALGALSGGLLLGPVGAVAGAVVGYTAGPSIARSWGLKGSPPRRPGRSAKRAKSVAAKKAAATHDAVTQDASAPGASGGIPAPRARPPAKSVGARNATPPVQAFE
jgi:hypothetical protein